MPDPNSLNKSDRLPSQPGVDRYLQFISSQVGSIWYIAEPTTFWQVNATTPEGSGEGKISWRMSVTQGELMFDNVAVLVGYIRLGNWASVSLGISGHLDPYATVFLINERLYGLPWQGGKLRDTTEESQWLGPRSIYEFSHLFKKRLVPVKDGSEIPSNSSEKK